MDPRGDRFKDLYAGSDVQGWFHHGDALLELIDTYRPSKAVELGTWLGQSAIPIAKLMAKWDGWLYCYDHYEGSDSFPEDLKPKLAKGMTLCIKNFEKYGVKNASLTRQDSVAAAQEHGDKTLDLVYIDAGHSFDACFADLKAWYPKLKRGGIMAGDDYGVERFGVTKAWDVFTHMLSMDEVCYQNGWAREGLVWLRKR